AMKIRGASLPTALVVIVLWGIALAGCLLTVGASPVFGAGMTYTYPGLLTATAAATVLAHTW
ncbi:MAG: hypothetical protein NT005_11710, partial [Spirochaetes bacterium]|nr:hypothetical protein [Spirochaetota bacterium]